VSQSLADIRARFVAREKTVVLVTDGGLLAEHERLTQMLEVALSTARTSIADDRGAPALAEQIKELEERIAEEGSLTIRLRGIGRNRFRQLMNAHPAPEEQESGGAFDLQTFPIALVAACSLDPVLTEDDAEELGDLITDGQWDQVFNAAWEACREADGVPFSALAWVTAPA
jgi:hypothetical protein